MDDAKKNIAPENKRFATTNTKKIKQKLLFLVLPQKIFFLPRPSLPN